LEQGSAWICGDGKGYLSVVKGKEGVQRKNAEEAYRVELLWQRKFKDFPVWHLTASPDSRFLAVAGGSEYLINKMRGIHLIRAAYGASLKFFDVGGGNYVSKVGFSHDGKLLAGDNLVWRVDDGTLVRKFEGSFVGFAREGDLIGIARGGSIEVRSVRDGSLLRRMKLPPQEGWRNFALSSDWSLVAEASGDWVRLWRMGQDRPVLLWEARVKELGKLAFSPDGRLLAGVYDFVIDDAPECDGLLCVQQNMAVLGVEDGEVVWKFATEFESDSPNSPPSSGAVFSPDGRLLALAGRDSIIRI